MWTRRAVIQGLTAAASAPALLHARTVGYGTNEVPTLSAIARLISAPDSQHGRVQLGTEAVRVLRDPLAFVRDKERQCAALRSWRELDARSIYFSINAADFRAGRIVEIFGISFSEIDVATFLVSAWQ